jgi:hypothetical protein
VSTWNWWERVSGERGYISSTNLQAKDPEKRSPNSRWYVEIQLSVPKFRDIRMSAKLQAGSSTSPLGCTSLSRLERILLGTTACALLEHKFFLRGLRIRRLLQPGTVIWLPSVFLLDVTIFLVVLYFLTAPKRWNLKTRAAMYVSKTIATLLALLVVLISSVSLMLMIQTGIHLFHFTMLT